jgi:hypothetical protein
MTILPRIILLTSLILVLSLLTGKSFAREHKPLGLAHGAGVWVNIWNYPKDDLDSYFNNLKKHGIANYFIQTSRSNTASIKHPEELGLIIEACHRQNIRIIGWSFGELIDPILDAEKMIDAANFKSQNMEQLDGIASNLEKNLEPWRIEKYSKHLRSKVGKTYPILAVVYSPLNKASEVKRIPWPQIARDFDVIAPMCYWSGKTQKQSAYQYTKASIDEVRRLSQRSDIELHIIGDGMGTESAQVLEFMRACKEKGVPSASLYPNFKVTPDQLLTLKHYDEYFEPNSRFAFSAYREMLNSACLESPLSLDPCELISRGNFYKLLVKRLNIGAKAQNNNQNNNIDDINAYHMLMTNGLLVYKPKEASANEFLNAPISSDEAFHLLARSVDKNAQKSLKSKRFDTWFTQPVQAAVISKTNKFNQNLTYLDAAKIVFQASLSFN